jgi:hypothetical protein
VGKDINGGGVRKILKRSLYGWVGMGKLRTVERCKVEFQLYRGSESKNCHTLDLWVDVIDSQQTNWLG